MAAVVYRTPAQAVAEIRAALGPPSHAAARGPGQLSEPSRSQR